MTKPMPATDEAYLVIDMDNLVRYALELPGRGFDRAAVVQLLEEIRDQTGLHLSGGVAAMNRATSEGLSMGVQNALNDWNVAVSVVRDEPEAADKELFYVMGRAVGQGFTQFVVVSKDKGFIAAANRVRGDVYDAGLTVVVDHLTDGVREQWSRLGDVRSWNCGRGPCRPGVSGRRRFRRCCRDRQSSRPASRPPSTR